MRSHPHLNKTARALTRVWASPSNENQEENFPSNSACAIGSWSALGNPMGCERRAPVCSGHECKSSSSKRPCVQATPALYGYPVRFPVNAWQTSAEKYDRVKAIAHADRLFWRGNVSAAL